MSRLDLSVVCPLDAFELEVNATLESGSIGLFGPSGAGKTSLLEVIAGWRPARRARIVVDGVTLCDTERGIALAPEARGVGYVPQDLLLFPHMTVAANLGSGAARAAGDASALAKAVDTLELGPLLERYPATLSGGEKQRVALGRALAGKPRLLLLDEPLAALDLGLRRRVLPYLLRVRDAFDLMLVVVSHDPTEVQALCDEVLLFDGGRMIEHGAPRRLLSSARLANTSFENVLFGTVERIDEGLAYVSCAGDQQLVLGARGLEPATELCVAVRADDILLAARRVPGLSARNQLAGVVEEVVVDGADVFVRARLGPDPDPAASRLWVSLTPSARRELGLESGANIVLIIKSQSFQRLA